MPAIIQFLGNNPLPPPADLAERLIQHRTVPRLTPREAADRMQVDQGTLARWERGERAPTGRFIERVERFLGGAGHGARPRPELHHSNRLDARHLNSNPDSNWASGCQDDLRGKVSPIHPTLRRLPLQTLLGAALRLPIRV
jgi:hypothetical protein